MAPVAAAHPDDKDKSDTPTVEHYEWSTAKARLGVMVMSLTPELREYFGAAKDRGVLVAKVEPKSAAATAGIAVGDVIVDVRGHTVDDATDVISALAIAKKGDTVSVQVIRNKKPLTLQAKITDTTMSMLDDLWPKWFQDFLNPHKPEQTARM
ncbi:MAG TPA: PDZ domain-containing protein [Kofleriaceae bacterium]|nr:PDZ domain-containing protein [Kofleriaceae bacterium]